MSQINHAEMVATLAKDGATIASELTPLDAHITHMAIGISGEAGELLDAVKKATIYRKDIDRINIIEELGDLEFYMEGLRQGLNITREETIEGNIAKLGKRYEGFKYSDGAAQQRADKVDLGFDSIDDFDLAVAQLVKKIKASERAVAPENNSVAYLAYPLDEKEFEILRFLQNKNILTIGKRTGDAAWVQFNES